MKVVRSERHIISKNHKMFNIVDDFCFKSKNLYNYANYIIRQEFIKNGKYISYNEMAKNIKQHESFMEIGSNSAQQTLRLLDKNWKSFFKSIKDWGKNKDKYLGKPRIPKYLPKDGRFFLGMTNTQTRIKNGFLYFSFIPFKPFNNLIKTNVSEKHMQTRFIPKADHYVLEIVFEKELNGVNCSDNERIIGIDLGLNRFATIQNNCGLPAFSINGGKIKAINNYYNKEVAKHQSIANKINNQKWTNRLQRLTTKRNNKLEYFMHISSRYIANYCIDNNIDTVVIGYNEEWKQKINIGKATQHFVNIPYDNFVNKLTYKLQDVGIKIIKTEESYTSKANSLNEDEMKKGEVFTGNRVERGLYETDDGIVINADVNGATNIIRKVFPNAFADGIKGVDLHPKIINVI